MRARCVGLALGALAMVLGCGEEERSPVGPVEPSAEAAPAAAAATAVVFQTVSAGTSHACAVATDGRGYCWGGTYGRTPVPVGGALRFIQVRAAIQHTCGLTTTNRVYCWGDNTSGQLGNGSTSQFSETPVEIAGGRRYRLLRTSSIGGFSCAITQAGATFCWGDNTHGQLGDGTTTLRRSPVRVKGGITFASVTLGAFHTCGLTAADQAYCWGDNQHGQLGIGNSFEQHLPRAVSGGLAFATLAAGWNHTCGVVGNVAYCWGRNASGQLGDGTRSRHGKPAPVSGGLRFRGVSAGGSHTCGVLISRAAYCWGYNWYGGLGDGTDALGDGPFVQFRTTPVAVKGGPATWNSVLAGGGNFTCGLTQEDGKVYCWGENTFHVLGDGSDVIGRPTPGPIASP